MNAYKVAGTEQSDAVSMLLARADSTLAFIDDDAVIHVNVKAAIAFLADREIEVEEMSEIGLEAVEINHDDCDAFYCPDCKLTFSLNELVAKNVEVTNEDGSHELSAYCPYCATDEAFEGNKMSNACHLEAHVYMEERT